MVHPKIALKYGMNESSVDSVLFSKCWPTLKVIDWCYRMRIPGSAALDMCNVASGRGDAYYQEYAIHCWDIAAGDLIVREAGGVVVDITGMLPWQQQVFTVPARGHWEYHYLHGGCAC